VRTARRRIERITAALEAAYGVPAHRRSRDLIGGLVETILSQNTTDLNSGRAYLALRERFADWDDVRRADVRSIESTIRGGGLARTKAGRIKKILSGIHAESGALDLSSLRRLTTDEVFEYLLSLDGVGMKTAACVALFDLHREVMPVDTHVHRVVGRLGVAGHPKTPEATFKAMRPLVPEGASLSLHINLIRLGRNVCRPREPRCPDCPVARECEHGRSMRSSAGRSPGSRARSRKPASDPPEMA
jgi:endonuclease-3